MRTNGYSFAWECPECEQQNFNTDYCLQCGAAIPEDLAEDFTKHTDQD